jgi:hypothetical protein
MKKRTIKLTRRQWEDWLFRRNMGFWYRIAKTIDQVTGKPIAKEAP